MKPAPSEQVAGDWLTRLVVEDAAAPAAPALPPPSHEPAEQPRIPALPAVAPPASRGRPRTFLLGSAACLLLGVAIAAACGLFRVAPTPAAAEPVVVKEATEVVVCERGTGQFTSLQAALARAEPGGRIRVKPGLYRGEIVLDREVTIVGDGPKVEIVLEGNSSDTVRLTAASATLRGLTVRARGAATNKKIHAVRIEQGRLALEDCDISSDCAAALCASGTSSPAILRCRFHDSPGGVLVHSGARPVLTGCTFENNSLAGLVVEKGGQPVVAGGSFRANQGDGILVRAGGWGMFLDCTLSGNKDAGVRTMTGGKPALFDCKIIDGNGVGLWAENRGEGSFERCSIKDSKASGVVLTGLARPRLVDCAIHDNNGNAVYAHHQGQGDFLRTTFSTRGSFSVVSIGTGSKLFLHGCRLPGGKNTAVFATEKGQGELVDCTIADHDSTQVHVEKESRLVLRGCTISNGKANGVNCREGGHVELADCTLEGNVLPQLASRGSAELKGCTVRGGKALGLFALAKGSVRAADCTIESNKDGGVFLRGATGCVIDRCRIRNNGDGVELEKGSDAVVRDCEFTGDPARAIKVQPDCKLTRSGNKGANEN